MFYSPGTKVIIKDQSLSELNEINATIIGSKRIRGHYVYSVRVDAINGNQCLDINVGDFLNNITSSCIVAVEPEK
jgi:hypothetical protein